MSPDELALWESHLANPTRATRNALILYYLPFAQAISHTVFSRLPFLEREDILSWGTLGLIEAIERFDMSRGVWFKSYAAPRIRGAILDALRANDWVPRSTRKRVRAGEEALQTVVSMDEMNQDPDAEVDLLADIASADTRAELAEVMGTLRTRERQVIAGYYFDHRTLVDISREFGVTESRVCQIHRKALGTLRWRLETALAAEALAG